MRGEQDIFVGIGSRDTRMASGPSWQAGFARQAGRARYVWPSDLLLSWSKGLPGQLGSTTTGLVQSGEALWIGTR